MSNVSKKPKTLSDFKTEFDPTVKVKEKIREALKSLAAEGPEAWELEQNFVTRCKTNFVTLSAYREQFSEHIVEVPGVETSRPRRVWFGDKRMAAKARG